MQRILETACVAAVVASACRPTAIMAGPPAASDFRKPEVTYAIREVGPCYGSNTDGREAKRIYDLLPTLQPALQIGARFRTPCIYAMPGRPRLFVVVADGRDERGVDGLRMSILREDAGALTIIFATPSWADGYSYQPAFVATDGRLLLAVEPGLEFSLELELYELVGASTVVPLGRIPAVEKREAGSLLPKFLARYRSGWEVAFCESVMIDVGAGEYHETKPKRRGEAIVFRQAKTGDEPAFRLVGRGVRGICGGR